MAEDTIKINMKWVYFEPDTRRYLQRSKQLVVDLEVMVEIPNDPEYVYGMNKDKPILTPLGMRLVGDILHDAFNDKEETETTEKWGVNEFGEIENWNDEEFTDDDSEDWNE